MLRQVGNRLSSKPYISSASRKARAEREASFLRWSSQQNCWSFSLRRSPMSLRQYEQTIVLPIKMPQCNRWVAPKECTKARIAAGLEHPTGQTRQRTLETGFSAKLLELGPRYLSYNQGKVMILC